MFLLRLSSSTAVSFATALGLWLSPTSCGAAEPDLASLSDALVPLAVRVALAPDALEDPVAAAVVGGAARLRVFVDVDEEEDVLGRCCWSVGGVAIGTSAGRGVPATVDPGLAFFVPVTESDRIDCDGGSKEGGARGSGRPAGERKGGSGSGGGASGSRRGGRWTGWATPVVNGVRSGRWRWEKDVGEKEYAPDGGCDGRRSNDVCPCCWSGWRGAGPFGKWDGSGGGKNEENSELREEDSSTCWFEGTVWGWKRAWRCGRWCSLGCCW